MASDVGAQVVTIRFQRPVDSDIVNKRFMDIRQLGIQKGGYLTKTGGDNVSLSALVCEISDGTHQVRVETTIAVTRTLTEGSPYLVLNWAYTGVVNTDYMVIETSSSPDANDLVIGKGIFVASALSTIDYSERSTPSTLSLFLRVEATETPSTSVRVRAGIGHAGSAHSAVIDQVVDLSGYSLDDVIYVYVNDSGGVAHSATASTYAGKALLAKIIYPAGVIANSIIADVRSFITSPAIPDEVTIELSSTGKLQILDRSQYLSMRNTTTQLIGQNAWVKANLGTVKNQLTITVSSSQITLTAGRKYALSYNVKGQPASGSTGDPHIKIKWVIVSGDSSWDLEDMSYAEAELAPTSVEKNLSNTCWIIPSSTTVIEMQIFTQNSSGQKSQVDHVTVNIMTVD